MRTLIQFAIIALVSSVITGCVHLKDNVIAGTGTVLGFEVSQNPATQLYQAKLGYSRAEIAFVPTDRNSTNSTKGAEGSPDVIMEIRYHGVMSNGGLYQRMAVGKNAVTQPGAAYMFAKNADGTLDPGVAAAITKSVQEVPTADAGVNAEKAPLASAYTQSNNKEAWDQVAVKNGYTCFADFLAETSTPSDRLSTVIAGLKAATLIMP